LAVVAAGLLPAACGVVHERTARSVVPDTPVGLAARRPHRTAPAHV